jgi:hypothetical protein
MFKKLCCAATALVALSSVVDAAEPGTTQVPKSVAATIGCWSGRGEVMTKSVTAAVTAKLIVQDALLSLDAESSALADPTDRYSAHLIVGGTDKQPGATADQIVGFWADSFGGAFTATGRGEGHPSGFDIIYQYADNAFVNRWRISGDHLTWQIAARDQNGVEKPFASYSLHKAACNPTQTR